MNESDEGHGLTPRALIVTIYGLYAREAGGFLPVAALVRLLAELSVEEPAVRSAISRLKRRGLLEPRRVAGAAGYALSDAGREILREGDERIFAPPAPGGPDGWLLAVFSIPETERQKRHTLRTRLTWLGFGTAAPGVRVAPAHRYDATVAVLRRLGLESYVDLFRADYLAFTDLRTAIGTWWDLPGLRTQYDEFLAGYRPVLARWRRREPDAHRAAAFADWIEALTVWRRLPYLDPGLPADLLPARWPGAAAADLFAALRDRLAAPAHDHVHTLITP
ncbi:PaaX family transcriptional regulator [Actinocatenispora rupis]|uniref:PaaX family transcriptional regulator n=1 Tax=Actinocatenispora rupis TaxID=519421 RepID=A0A8J3JCK9_9ACTN|nr:PaaX family transcriptional regulator C-terminal domain-containing protein [Actinocatenispora rupis]GID14022.1 PaaX family transcriptional regulator [Actinocatenispora rupis]